MREVADIEFVHLQETPEVLASLDALLTQHLASRPASVALQEQTAIMQEREKRKLVKAAIKEKSKENKRIRNENAAQKHC